MTSDTHAPTPVEAFAQKIVEEGTILDPWYDGTPRVRPDPFLLPSDTAATLDHVAESVGEVWDEAGRILSAAEDDPFLEDFFHVTPTQRAMWLSSMPRWHGVARADVFLTPEGPRVAELNCDTPTGQAETVVLASLAFAEARRAVGDETRLVDPSTILAPNWTAMVRAYASQLPRRGSSSTGPTVGIVYPTELTEDLPLVRIYRRWLEAAGFRVVLGSPFNLQKKGDDVALFDEPISVLVRHYKTDWWGERESAWDDEEIPDALPLVGPLTAVLEAEIAGRCVVVNPFGSILHQNKRCMAFMWEHIHRFSTTSQSSIQSFIPPTFRAEAMHVEQLLAQRAEWVLKSDYGAEGDEVIVGKDATDEEWQRALEHARPGRWVVQQYFETIPEPSGELANHGVWLVAGQASGHYTRYSTGPTDDRAVSVPTFVRG